MRNQELVDNLVFFETSILKRLCIGVVNKITGDVKYDREITKEERVALYKILKKEFDKDKE